MEAVMRIDQMEDREIVVTKEMKDRQNVLKEQYRGLLEKYVWKKSPRMVDFCMGEVLWIAELPNGMIVVIAKQKIETRFCFGYSLSKYDSEDYDAAGRLAESAKSDVAHFIRENMDWFDQWIRDLYGYDPRSGLMEISGSVPYMRVKYSGLPEDSNLRSLSFATGSVYGDMNYYGKSGQFVTNGKFVDYVPTDEEVSILVNAFKIARQLHKKKVMAYLKRYGLSKVDTWTYWRDE